MHELSSLFAEQLKARRSERTVHTYRGIATTALRFFEARGVDRVPADADVVAFLSRPGRGRKKRASSTHNQELAALRAFAAFAVEHGLWPTNPTMGIPFAREAPRDPAVLSVAELRRFFSAAAEDHLQWRRARNLAVLALLSQAGLRVHELVALNIEQIDVASATVVAVRGKGGTVHDVPMNAPTMGLVTAWVAERKYLSDRNANALFVSGRGARLSIRSVQRLIASLRASVGTKKHVTPHTFRHTTATLALALGSDLSTVGDLLRHSDLNTTRRYLHLVDERRRDAVRRLAVAIPDDVVASQGAEMRSETVGPCAERSFKSAADSDSGVDAQYGLDDVAEAA